MPRSNDRLHLALSRAKSPTASDRVVSSSAEADRLPDLLSQEQWTALIREMRLSNREADILRSAFYSDRTDAVAEKLGLAASTVHTYRDRLYRKLGVASLTQAVGAAFAAYVRLNARLAREEGD